MKNQLHSGHCFSPEQNRRSNSNRLLMHQNIMPSHWKHRPHFDHLHNSARDYDINNTQMNRFRNTVLPNIRQLASRTSHMYRPGRTIPYLRHRNHNNKITNLGRVALTNTTISPNNRNLQKLNHRRRQHHKSKAIDNPHRLTSNRIRHAHHMTRTKRCDNNHRRR